MSKASKRKSWNHAIRLLTENERNAFDGLGMKCSRCATAATHQISYWSATGVNRKESQSKYASCTPHAQQFAGKNHLDMPDPIR